MAINGEKVSENLGLGFSHRGSLGAGSAVVSAWAVIYGLDQGRVYGRSWFDVAILAALWRYV